MSDPAIQPNILIVLADDHQKKAIGALNEGRTISPNLDQLIERGTLFEKTHIMGGLIPAVCSPSRACILTGHDPFHSTNSGLGGLESDYVKIKDNLPTLPEWFRTNNYQTHIAGKWHNDIPALLRSFEKGTHVFNGGMCNHDAVPLSTLENLAKDETPRFEKGYSTELFAKSTKDFLQSRDRTKPFFSWLSLTSPHDPRTPPPEFEEWYEPDRIPLPDNFLPNHPFDNGELHIRDEVLLSKPLNPSEVRQEIANYYAMISHHDSEIGKVFETLKECGDLDNTLVVYLSDHGLALGQHGLLGKQNLYEHSVSVPMILAGPGVPKNSVHQGMIYSLDLFPLLCHLAQLKVPDSLDSLPIHQSGFPGASFKRDSIFSFYKDVQRMVSDGRWKLIAYFVNSQLRYQLFDLRNDPHELNNLVDEVEHMDEFQRLNVLLNDWQKKTKDPWINFFQPNNSIKTDQI